MGCSDGEFGMVWGSPVLCSQQGSFSVMRLCVSAGCLDLCSVGWQVCCFKGCIGGLSAPCCVFQCFCKHIDFVLPYVYMVIQVSDCDRGVMSQVHIGQASTSFGDVSVDSLDGVWVNVSAG